MWNGLCGELIRSRNRNLLRKILWLAVGPMLFLGYNHRYFIGFFRGAENLSISEIRGMTAGAASDWFVKITLDHWNPTGMEQWGTSSKYDTVRRFDGTYMLASDGKSDLLLYIDHHPRTMNVKGRFFEGLLVPLTDRYLLRSPDSDRFDPRPYGPVFLDTDHYLRFGRLGLFVAAFFLLPALYCCGSMFCASLFQRATHSPAASRLMDRWPRWCLSSTPKWRRRTSR